MISFRPGRDTLYPQLFEDPIIKELAKKYNKSPAQIAIKYQVCLLIINNFFENNMQVSYNWL